jgi:hypothetical protein
MQPAQDAQQIRNNYPATSAIAGTVISGGVGALGGFIVSKIFNTSPLLSLIWGVEMAVSTALNSIIDEVARVKNIAEHKVTLLKAAVYAVTTAAAVVATVALGIFGTPYIIATAVIGGVCILAMALKAAFQYYQLHRQNQAQADVVAV